MINKCPICGLDGGVTEFICACGHHVKLQQGPSLFAKGMHVVVATYKHAKDRFRKVDDATREERLAICQSCDYHNGKICTHKDCGCGIKTSRAFLDKLSWASERCPIDKWSAKR